MKEKIINLLIRCDMQNSDILSCAQMSPSSSIEEIAEYLAKYMNENGEIKNGRLI